MGYAMLQGWMKHSSSFSSITVVTPHSSSLKEFQNHHQISWFSSPEHLKSNFDVIVFAVKPYQLSDVLPHYRQYVDSKTIVISIAAGKTLEFYRSYFAPQTLFVRAMPNTPSIVSKGIILLISSTKLQANSSNQVQEIMEVLGQIFWLEDEELFDKAASLSSCGPGYVFHLVECFEKAAIELGLEQEIAQKLSRELFVGCGAYLENTAESAQKLRDQVTSPKGMTEAALKVLMGSNFQELINKTLRAAYERAKEIRKEG